MANYALTVFDTKPEPTVAAALAALETQLETVDDTKTIYLLDIVKTGQSGFIGYAIYAT